MSRRLKRTVEAVKGRAIKVIIDETGDRKKGKKTEYVARQGLGSVGKVDRGRVELRSGLQSPEFEAFTNCYAQ